MSGSRGSKRQRTEEEEDAPPAATREFKLKDGLKRLLGGRKYVDEQELTREVLLNYLMGKGEVTVVNRFDVQSRRCRGRF